MLGGSILGRPLRTGAQTVARVVREVAPRRRIRVPPMSGNWLREHRVDARKHSRERG